MLQFHFLDECQGGRPLVYGEKPENEYLSTLKCIFARSGDDDRAKARSPSGNLPVIIGHIKGVVTLLREFLA